MDLHPAEEQRGDNSLVHLSVYENVAKMSPKLLLENTIFSTKLSKLIKSTKAMIASTAKVKHITKVRAFWLLNEFCRVYTFSKLWMHLSMFDSFTAPSTLSFKDISSYVDKEQLLKKELSLLILSCSTAENHLVNAISSFSEKIVYQVYWIVETFELTLYLLGDFGYLITRFCGLKDDVARSIAKDLRRFIRLKRFRLIYLKVQINDKLRAILNGQREEETETNSISFKEDNNDH